MRYLFEFNEDKNSLVVGRLIDFDITESGSSGKEVEKKFFDLLPVIFEVEFRKKRRPMSLPSKSTRSKAKKLGSVYVPVRFQLRILLWNEILKKDLSIAKFSELMGLRRQVGIKYFNGASGVSVEKYEAALLKIGHFPEIQLH